MDPINFAKAMNSQAPELQALTSLGMSEGEALEIRKGFLVPKSKSRRLDTELPLDIAELFESYDLSATRVGPLSFLATPEVHDLLVLIGKYDEDLLVVDIGTGHVSIRDKKCRDKEIWSVASSFPEFLESISFAARALHDRIFSDSLYEDIAANVQLAHDASKRSGTSGSVDFFKTMLGV